MTRRDTDMVKIGTLLPKRAPKPALPPPPEVCWTCPTCGPVEPLQLPTTGRWIRRSCQCERDARARATEESIRQAKLADMTWRCYGGWLGEAFLDRDVMRVLSRKTFANYAPQFFPEAFELATTFAANPHGNLVFYGTFGSGKTHLEAAICNELRMRGIQSYFVPAPQFFLAYNDLLVHGGDAPGLIKRAQTVPLLVIDDIDKARPTEARWDTYWLVLNARYTAGRPTVLSTNRMDTLYEYIGEACVSRLTRGMIPVEMMGLDYRAREEAV